VAEWARQGPDAERHKVVRWRLIDLRDEIAARFGVQLHERSVGKLLARLKFSHVSARPRHPEQDGSAQEAHKKTLPPSSRPRVMFVFDENGLTRSDGFLDHTTTKLGR
jgi:transposase